MKIYKLSRILIVPFALVFIWFIYKVFDDYTYEHFAWAIIPTAISILIYLFQPQIDYWWLSRRPIEIDPPIKSMIDRINPLYGSLNHVERMEFDKRLLLYTNGREFLAKGIENDFEVPYDVQYMLAQIPVTITRNRKDFLLKNFDRIIVYKHAFGSPMHKFLHTAETHIEDGVIILSLEHVEAAFVSPQDYYNIAWHAYVEAFITTEPDLAYPLCDETTWDKITLVSGFTKERILHTVGFEDLDVLIVTVVLYFTHREKFKLTCPRLSQELDKIL